MGDYLGPYLLGPNDENQGIYTGDARELAKAIPDESVDLLIEDPPYGIGYASSWKTRNGGGPRRYRASFGPDILNTAIVEHYSRVLKSSGALYLFTRWDVLQIWRSAVESCGFSVKQRIVWNKSHWKMGDLKYYGSQTEDILFCLKSRNHELRWDKRGGNLWSSSSSAYLPEGQWDHPTQKPEAIIKRIVENSSDAGDLVIDMHVGSGTVPAICKQLARRWLAFEIDPDTAEMARERVRNTQPPLPGLVTPEQQEMDLAVPELA